MLSVTVSSEGNVKLPKKVREILQVKPGARINFHLERDEVRMRADGAECVRQLSGSLRKYAQAGSRNPRSAVKETVARAAAQEG